MRKALRLLLYVTFAVAAAVFWGAVLLFYVGISMGDGCISGMPCDRPPSVSRNVIGAACIFGSIPLTMFAFMFFRKGVLRLIPREPE